MSAAPNHLVYLVLDSCRYDSFVEAATPNMDRVGAVERRYSYASWTSPAHYALLMGMLPHRSVQGVYASEVYKREYGHWVERLGIEGLAFRSFLPELSLPKLLRAHGYRTVARVSLPVLNEATSINRYFDDYALMDRYDDFEGMVGEIHFPAHEPSFYFLNLGETHYPYMLEGEDLPQLSGVHGVLRGLGQGEAAVAGDGGAGEDFFDADQMARLHRQQVRCVEHVDTVFARLLASAPSNTHFIITADHGECFGEEGHFGHGPIYHPKVFEVPFLEGRVA